MQPYFNTTSQNMGDNLIFFLMKNDIQLLKMNTTSMEDDLHFFQIEDDPIFLWLEDDLKRKIMQPYAIKFKTMDVAPLLVTQ